MTNHGQMIGYALKCEGLVEPMGVDAPRPRLAWRLQGSARGARQSAYEIEAAGSADALDRGEAGLWLSGKVVSSQQTHVPWGGAALGSDQICFWRVRVWDERGQVGPWSAPTWFHTGLLQEADWQGRWIGAAEADVAAPWLRRTFELASDVPLEAARLFVAGLGYHELYINGQRVGDHVLDPTTSEYDKRVYYVTYDVRSYLRRGANTVGVWLGNGWLRHRAQHSTAVIKAYSDRPKLLLQCNLRYADGRRQAVVSDDQWRGAASPITQNSIWDGERYDARREIADWAGPGGEASAWSPVAVLDGPGGALGSQLMPPMRVVQTRRAWGLAEPSPGVYVFDFGQNVTGWPRLHVSGEAGTEVTLRMAEMTREQIARMQGEPPEAPAGLIDPRPNRSAQSRDCYVLKGEPGGETYEPRFTYHGFRYVQVEGLPAPPDLLSLEARVVHTDVARTGRFECSNSQINHTHEMIRWSQRGNLHGVPTDCPQRDERQGWTGDGHLMADQAFYNFDMQAVYRQWLRSYAAAQNPDGSLPDTVPYHNFARRVGTPAWQIAYPVLVWKLYWYDGDVDVLAEHYERLERLMACLAGTAEDGLITWGRGDWCPPQRTEPADPVQMHLTSTGYWHHGCRLLAQMGHVLGRTEDARRWEAQAGRIAEAFQEAFYDAQRQTYADDSITANAFALFLNLVPAAHVEGVVHRLVTLIQEAHDGHIWAGILGSKAAASVLPASGHADLLYRWGTLKTFPSYGFMLAQGATTLWERWGGYRYFDAGMNSLNHIMFGAFDEFLYRDLAGIAPEEPGYRTIRFAPRPVGDLQRAGATVDTPYGACSCDWQREGAGLTVQVAVPVNATGRLRLPWAGPGDARVDEQGRLLWAAGQPAEPPAGVSVRSAEAEALWLDLESGTYRLRVWPKW